MKLDTTIFIPAEKSSLLIPIERIKRGFVKPKIYTQRKGRSKVTVKIDSTGITATSNCDSIAKQFEFYKQTIKELRKEVNEIKITKSEKKGYNTLQLILYMLVASITSIIATYFLTKFKII